MPVVRKWKTKPLKITENFSLFSGVEKSFQRKNEKKIDFISALNFCLSYVCGWFYVFESGMMPLASLDWKSNSQQKVATGRL